MTRVEHLADIMDQDAQVKIYQVGLFSAEVVYTGRAGDLYKLPELLNCYVQLLETNGDDSFIITLG